METTRASVEFELAEADLIVERANLLAYLVERAESGGAPVHVNQRFVGMTSDGAGARLSFETPNRSASSVTAGAVIGADGAFSRVGAAARISRPPIVPIVQAEVDLPAGWNPALTKVWIDPKLTRFFFWLVPDSPNHGVFGLIGDAGTDTRPVLDHFVARFGTTVQAYQAARVPLHHPRLRPWSHIGSARVILVGDAAGQVKASTVGGTVAGMWGADAAARSVIDGKAYARTVGPLKRELDLHWLVRLVLERLDATGYDRLVRAVSPSVRSFLGQHNRDTLAGEIWRVPVFELRLLGLVIQGLLRGPKATPTGQETSSILYPHPESQSLRPSSSASSSPVIGE